ncbi:hypothetical protein FocnCong_v020612 [Fusarium oxysporum f. sp. conglutinans]|nr:hypothetical protein FocnCong_v020612 [Fusarium oxysporum f. sp. conglutinans]
MIDVVSIVIAVISFVGTLITAGVSAWYKWFSEEQTRRNDAEKLISKYRDPLLLASQDLQSRLYNITDNNLTLYFRMGADKRDNILLYTAFLIGQYFSWAFILRRQAQFLRFSTDKANRDLTRILGGIAFEFSTDGYPPDGAPFMIWRGQQMAVGGIMTVNNGDELMCLGYASFHQMFKNESDNVDQRPVGDEDANITWDGNFRPWFRSIIQDIIIIAEARERGNNPPDQRLRRLQHLLIDLINILDDKGLRSEAKFTSRCHRAIDCNCSKCSGNEVCPCVRCNPDERERARRKWDIWGKLSWRRRRGHGEDDYAL